MADEEGQEEKKDKEKQEGEQVKALEMNKAKKGSKTVVGSKISLNKTAESAGSAKSVGSSNRSSGSSMMMKGPSSFDKIAKVPRYQNTYRLDSKKPFKPHEVYKILQAIVLREVEEHPHYESLTAAKLVQTIAADVRNSVKLLNYDRYKICVLVYLGEKKLQGFQAAFRALWDHERDAWTTYFYQCRTYFISCTCYGIYHD